ncbi:MAG: biopolymer transporter ExbD [Myxococcota bacterium]|nr:biopolymer transporter ExbD [Myxococcota bacterium]
MSFSLGGDDDQPVAEINITPMVDIMLVLLIIFMVTGPMMKQGVDVNLPETASSPVSTDDDRLVLTMTAKRHFFLGKTPIPADQLATKLGANTRIKEGKALYLHADASLGYGEVVAVMASLRQAGVRQLGLITDPEPPKP